jgi:hypothetical protein
MSQDYAPPSGPPPSHASSSSTYPPPDGPPPSYQNAIAGDIHAAPVAEPPPYPPPPGLNHDFSTGANATKGEAEQARLWCNFYPLTPPFPMPPNQLRAIHAHDHTLCLPPGFRGTAKLTNQTYHTWRVISPSGTKDTLIQTALPYYSYYGDSPMLTERSKTIYFEIQVRSFGTPPSKSKLGSLLHRQPVIEESGVAIGFFAPPYPAFRLPGWQRGSIGVHSDDGRRFVGNDEGGVDFTAPFQVGETIGLGMTFEARHSDEGPRMNVEVFLTRDGKKAGGWNLLNDTDSEFESVDGLTGDNDIFPAIGIFGPLDVELHFGEESWLYRGWNQSA